VSLPVRLPTLLVLAALVPAVAACGSDAPVSKVPRPGVVTGNASKGGARPDTANPSGKLIACLAQARVSSHVAGPDTVAVDPPEAGMHVVFQATPGQAQYSQLHGGAEGAEVILSALLYVGRASDSQILPVERCVDHVAPD
jgi:hypothetical protein